MAAQKFLTLVSGILTQISAITSSAGAGDEGKLPALDASGKLDTSFMPTGLGADTQVLTASEALSAGDLVNVWSNAGVFAVRKADATSVGKPADGYVLSSVSSGAPATVYGTGTNTGVSGLSPGRVYLSSTAGGITQDVSTYTGGKVIQDVGFASASGELWFQRGTPITTA